MNLLELLPNETINHIISYLDIASFWRLGATSQRLIGFRFLTDEQWRQKYAQTYHLNEEEIACYKLHHDWSEMYKLRYANEFSFLKEIEKARNQILQARSTSNHNQTDEDSDSDNYDDMYYYTDPVKRDHPVLHALFKKTLRSENRTRVFKPECNPWYTLLITDDINEIKHAINNIHYSLLRSEYTDSYRMIDVLVTVLSKNLKAHPELAEHLQYKNLGEYLYSKSLNFPYTTVALGSISLLLDHLHENSPYLEGILESLKMMPYNNPRVRKIWHTLHIPTRIYDLLTSLQQHTTSENTVLSIAEEILRNFA